MKTALLSIILSGAAAAQMRPQPLLPVATPVVERKVVKQTRPKTAHRVSKRELKKACKQFIESGAPMPILWEAK